MMSSTQHGKEAFWYKMHRWDSALSLAYQRGLDKGIIHVEFKS